MDAEEVFLNCSNLTLWQYRAIALTRGLTGAVGCIVSLAALVIVLLINNPMKNAWKDLLSRVYLTNILYTFLYSIVAIAAVNYSPSQESTWCAARGFLLHYTGTLVVVHYCALAFAIMLLVIVPDIVPMCKAANNKIVISPRIEKRLEVLLFLVLFFCPILNTWQPFLPQLPSYGNYGPLCWFRLELTGNCTTNTLDVRFLQAVPFAVLSFAYCVTFTISLITLFCRYYNFKHRAQTTGRSLTRVILTVLLLTVITFVMTAWFIVSALPSKSLSDVRSFSTWLENVTVTLAVTVGILVPVGIFVHFTVSKDMCLPIARELKHMCLHCRRARGLNIQQVNPPAEGDLREVGHHNPVAYSHFNPPADETTPLVDHRSHPTPTATPPQEMDHNSSRTETTCSNIFSHSPVTSTAHLLEVDHDNDLTPTVRSSSYLPVTTPRISISPPVVDQHIDPTDITCSNFSHSPVTTTT